MVHDNETLIILWDWSAVVGGIERKRERGVKECLLEDLD